MGERGEGRLPDDIGPKASSSEHLRDLNAADRTPEVEAALQYMEAHDSELEAGNVSPLDAILEEYSQSAKQLQATTDPVKRETLHQQLLDVRRRVIDTSEFDAALNREFDAAVAREDQLEQREQQLATRQELRPELSPENPATPEAERFLKLRRTLILTWTIESETANKIASLPARERANRSTELQNIMAEIQSAVHVMQQAPDFSRHPERIPVETWNDLLDRCRDSFEKLLILQRSLPERAAHTSRSPERPSSSR